MFRLRFRIASKPIWACLLAFAGALAWRIPHLRWGLPDVEEEALPMKKAFEMWGWESGTWTLDPQTAGWPSLSFYLQLALQKLHYTFGQLRGSYTNPYDYWLQYQIDPGQLVLLARLSSALMGAAVVWIATLGAQRLVGWRGALLAGLVLACSPMAIRHSQLVTPDILLMFFAALGALALLRLESRGHARDYVLAGVWTGLGAASKYTPVLLVIAIFALHLLRLAREGRSLHLLGLDDRRLGYAALAALLAFCVASPYTFADLEVLRRDFAYQAMHMSRGHFGHEGRSFGPAYYFTKVLVPAFGWPALLAGMAGLIVGARRTLVPILVAGLFFAGLAFLNTQFDRYMLPVLLPLSWGIAQIWAWGEERLPSRWARAGAWAGAAGLLLWSPVDASIDYHRLQARESTQRLAKDYVLETIPAESSRLAIENYTVFLPYDQSAEWQSSPIWARLDERQRRALLERPTYSYQVLPMYSARTELGAYYYDLRHYVAYDWIVTSSSVRGRYQRQPARYPEQNRFYEDLERYCELVRDFAPGTDARGPDIRFYRFAPDGIASLLRDRGELSPDHWSAYRERLHPPHFFAFIDLAAAHALSKDRFEVAEYYYGIEYATCGPEERPRVASQLAYVKIRLQKWEEASSLYRELLREMPEDLVALGNLAYAQWQLGNADEARELFMRCIALAGDGPTANWARQRLSEMDSVD